MFILWSLPLYFQDYSEMSKAYRPSHADATYDYKYGVRSVQVRRLAFPGFILILRAKTAHGIV